MDRRRGDPNPIIRPNPEELETQNKIVGGQIIAKKSVHQFLLVVSLPRELFRIIGR